MYNPHVILLSAALHLAAMSQLMAQVTLTLSDGATTASAQTAFQTFTGASVTTFGNDGISSAGGGWTVDFGTNASPFGFIGGSNFTAPLSDINQPGNSAFTRTHSSGFSYSVTMWGLTSNPSIAANTYVPSHTQTISSFAVAQTGDMTIERYGGALASRGVQQGGANAGSSLAPQITQGSTNSLWGFDSNAGKTETPNRTDMLLFQFNQPLTRFGYFGADWESSPNNPSKFFIFDQSGNVVYWNTFTWTNTTTGFGNDVETFFGINSTIPIWAIAFAVGNDDNNASLDEFLYNEVLAIGGFTFQTSEIPEPRVITVTSLFALLGGAIALRRFRKAGASWMAKKESLL